MLNLLAIVLSLKMVIPTHNEIFNVHEKKYFKKAENYQSIA